MSSSLARRATAEILGTALLVFLAASAVIMDAFPGAGYHILGMAIAYAFATALAITMTAGISGGHLNPAITIALCVVRRITVRDAFVYVVSQLIGALIAGLLVRWLIPYNVGRLYALGTPGLNNTITFGHGVLLEALFTFALMSVVMGTMVVTNLPRLTGYAVGLALIPITIVGGALTGGIANPARAFGPAIISGQVAAQAVWWIGPIAGALIAAALWQFLLSDERIPQF